MLNLKMCIQNKREKQLPEATTYTETCQKFKCIILFCASHRLTFKYMVMAELTLGLEHTVQYTRIDDVL